MRILIVIILMLLTALAHAQTHTMPGSNVVPSGASLTINSGASITAAVGSTVTGFGGGGTPGGSTTQVQFNDGGAFGGDAGMTYNKATDQIMFSSPFGGIVFDSDANTGFVNRNGTGDTIDVFIAGTAKQMFRAQEFGLASDAVVGWSTTTDAIGTADAAIARSGTNALKITDGSSGFGDLKAKTINSTTGFQLNGVEFPTASNGLVKRTAANTYAAATASTDYAPATSGSSILYGNGSGGFSNVTVGTGLSFTTGTLTATAGAVSITATSPIVVAPTPLTATGVVSLDKTVDLAMTAVQSVTVSNAAGAGITDILTIGHNYNAGAGTANFGTGILFNAEDSTTDNVNIAEISAFWTNATHNSNVSKMNFKLLSGGLSLSGSASLSGAGIFDVSGGFSIGASAPSGRILIGDGTKFIISTPTYPNAASTAGKLAQSDGTNIVMSTPTWPTAAGTAGYTLRSDGTNVTSYPQDMFNSSVTSQATFSTSDIYITNSNVTVAAGDMKAKGQYRCLFDMTKSAGTGAIVISVRVGTAGAIGDAQILTFTFGAGTAVADTGTFEIIATWRTVGSGTTAVMQGICRAQKNAATTTGLWNNAGTDLVIVAATSSGFNSTTATNIGVSFNGSTTFAGTSTLCQATLIQ